MALPTPVSTPFYPDGDLKPQAVQGILVQGIDVDSKSISKFRHGCLVFLLLLLMVIVATTTSLAIFFALRSSPTPALQDEVVGIVQSVFEDTFFQRLSKVVIFSPQSHLELAVSSYKRVNGGFCGSKVVLVTDHGDLEIDQQTFTLHTNETLEGTGLVLSRGPGLVLLGSPRLEAHLKTGPTWQWSPCVSKLPDAPEVMPTLPAAFELSMVLHTPCRRDVIGGFESCYQLSGLPRPGFVVVDSQGYIQMKQRMISDFPRFQRIETTFLHTPDQTVVDIVNCHKLSMKFQVDAKTKNNHHCEFEDFENHMCKNATDLQSRKCDLGEEIHPTCYMQLTEAKFSGKVDFKGVPHFKFTLNDYSLGSENKLAMHMYYNSKTELTRIEIPELDLWASVNTYRPLTPAEVDPSLFSMPVCKVAPSDIPIVEETAFAPEPLTQSNKTDSSVPSNTTSSKLVPQAYKGAFPGTGCGYRTVLPLPVFPFIGSSYVPYSMEIGLFQNLAPCSFQFTAKSFTIGFIGPNVQFAGEIYVEADTGYRNLYAEGCFITKIGYGFALGSFKVNIVEFSLKMCGGVGSTNLHGVQVLMAGFGGEGKLKFFAVVDVKVFAQFFFVPYKFPAAVSPSPHARTEVGVSASVSLLFLKASKSFSWKLPSSDWYHLN